MTLREGALVQSFPSSWSWDGVRLDDAWKLLGNAVPPKLAEHLGRVLLQAAAGGGGNSDRHDPRPLGVSPQQHDPWPLSAGDEEKDGPYQLEPHSRDAWPSANPNHPEPDAPEFDNRANPDVNEVVATLDGGAPSTALYDPDPHTPPTVSPEHRDVGGWDRRHDPSAPTDTRAPLPLLDPHHGDRANPNSPPDRPPDPPLYVGDIEADALALMQNGLAEEITGGLSWPSKMDCPAWGLPARRCRKGRILAKKPGTVCHQCYALKGNFTRRTVSEKLERAYQGLFDPRWTPALYVLIQRHTKETRRFRFFHSGDIQGVNHFRNILRICAALPDILFWIPTREDTVVIPHADAIPANACVRASGTGIDGPPPGWWPITSTVVTDPARATCPSSIHGGNCGTHQCTKCWALQGNVAYLKH
jgi:hypothetical protein